MKQYNHIKGITLMELLIAIGLLSMVVLALSSIDLFSRHHLIDSDRRARLQNEVSYALEHMTQQISGAVGNMAIQSQIPINTTAKLPDPAISILTDSNGDGQGDTWMIYWFKPSDHLIWYCPNCTGGASCPSCASSDSPNIAQRIATFNATNTTDNYVNVNIIGRWEPAQAESVDNPQVSMNASIKMPSVSTH